MMKRSRRRELSHAATTTSDELVWQNLPPSNLSVSNLTMFEAASQDVYNCTCPPNLDGDGFHCHPKCARE